MKKHPIAILSAAVLAAAMLLPAPAFAGHRPGNVVVLGGTFPLTGRYVVHVRPSHDARKLYVDELNARGGLLGHQVQLKILDDKSDRRTAIELYEKLITEDKVDLVLGPKTSYITDPVANVMERYKRPFITPGASSPVIWQRGRKYIFSAPIALAQGHQKGALQLAEQIGVKRIAVIGEGSLFPRQVTEGALAWAKKLGLNVVLLESYRKEQTDFTALLRKIEASGAEAIFSSGYYDDMVAQVRQLRELDINVKMFAATIGPGIPKFVEELGSTAEYVVGYSSWEPKPSLGHPGMKAFIESYEKRYGEKPNTHSALGYTEMRITEAAVKRAGSFDPEKVREALASVPVYTILGPWKADERGYSRSSHISFHITYQIQNGKRVIVWPEHVAEGKFIPMPKWEDRAKK